MAIAAPPLKPCTSHAAPFPLPATWTRAGSRRGTLLARRYRIVSLLGRGGMGEVYRANDLLLAQAVALKFLPAQWTSDEPTLARFRNEVRIARQISHPNVCRVYDIGEAEGATYLSMEYVDGEDLASLLRRIRRLPRDKALEIARQLCAGLAAAHDKGVVHRDLKPGNIMLDGQGQLRITDFGLAGVASEVKDIRSGTPAYTAPEQRSGKKIRRSGPPPRSPCLPHYRAATHWPRRWPPGRHRRPRWWRQRGTRIASRSGPSAFARRSSSPDWLRR